jgi:hypothetical protein
MMDLFFGDNAGWFSVAAIIGTGFFIVRVILLMVGHHGMPTDLDTGDVHTDPADAFKALSIQTITAFLMGFGWAALGAYRGSDLHWGLSAAIGVVGGVVMVWFLALLLKAVYDLQSSGNIDLKNAIGSEADVYLTVPGRGSGRGQIRVIVQDRQRIINAVTDGEAIPTSSRVRITRVNEDNTLTVSPA